MPADPPLPELHETTIATIRHHEDIEKAIESGTIDFTEQVRWVKAEAMLKELDPNEVVLPVLLADATSEQRGIMAWGKAKRIIIDGNQTRIVLEEVVEIPSRPVISSLWCQSTQDYLSDEDQRNYRIVDTPPFILYEPSTFILTWNPKKQIPMEEFQQVRESILDGDPPEWNWTCYSTNKVCPGDRFLMLRQGDEPRGIVGSGWIRSYAWTDDDDIPHVDMVWDWMLDPDEPLDPRAIAGAEDFHWKPQKSGMELTQPACDVVWQAWAERIVADGAVLENGTSASEVSSNEDGGSSSPQDEAESQEDPVSSLEGRLVESWGTRRERDPDNRARCLALHEPRCVVCAMSFLEEYGEIGRDFIHVHHERPLGGSDAMEGSHHDPGSDMKPVCPNCHAMLHRGLDARKGMVRTIAELKQIRGEIERRRARG